MKPRKLTRDVVTISKLLVQDPSGELAVRLLERIVATSAMREKIWEIAEDVAYNKYAGAKTRQLLFSEVL